jgi:ribonuclease P protein component
MLPSSRRVSRILFEKTLHEGKVFHGAFFSLRIAAHEGETRFGVVVSKKIDKRATKRNALRRKVYRLLAGYGAQVQSGFTSIFFMKKGAEAASPEMLNQAIVVSLKQAGVLRT